MPTSDAIYDTHRSCVLPQAGLAESLAALDDGISAASKEHAACLMAASSTAPASATAAAAASAPAVAGSSGAAHPPPPPSAAVAAGGTAMPSSELHADHVPAPADTPDGSVKLAVPPLPQQPPAIRVSVGPPVEPSCTFQPQQEVGQALL